jgi:hypothetical protein
MRFGRKQSPDGRLKSLARKIETVAQKDQEQVRKAQEAIRLCRSAAAELHVFCRELVEAINGLLTKPLMELSPAEYTPEAFQEDGPNVFQINVSGRIVQLEFHTTAGPSSTEKLATPYILEGAIRAFNQELLDLLLVPEQQLFCCPQAGKLNWVWLDTRSQRASPLDQERLISLLERLM